MLDSFTLFDWSPSFGIGRRARKLLVHGEAAPATIAGIKVTHSGDSESSNSYLYAYLLDVRTGAGVRRMACRQFLAPQRALAHLGEEVSVRLAKDQVIIDWAATLAGRGLDGAGGGSTHWWKTLDPAQVPEGVDDHEQGSVRKWIARQTPATATVLRVTELTSRTFGMSLENLDVDLQLTLPDGSTRQTMLRKIIPPDYARHLVVTGTVLPAAVSPSGDQMIVDWIAAANGGASHDPAPPVPTRKLSEPAPATAGSTAGGKLLGAFEGLMGKALDAGGLSAELPPEQEIPFQTFVEVTARIDRTGVPPSQQDRFAQQFGVPAGAWGPASRAWQSRLARDLALSAEYREAYAAAYGRTN